MRDYTHARTLRQFMRGNQFDQLESVVPFMYEWHDTICLGIGSVAAAISTLMLVLLGMDSVIAIVSVALAAPLIGGILAYVAAVCTRRYLFNLWGYGIAAVIGFLAGPIALGGFLFVIRFMIARLA